MTNFDANQLLKATETELLDKRKRSRFFDDYEKTKNYLEKNIIHNGFVAKFTNEWNKFVTDG